MTGDKPGYLAREASAAVGLNPPGADWGHEGIEMVPAH